MQQAAHTFQHGLIIGKFYPPHAGHHYLIRSAAYYCQQLTVVVMPASHESIDLSLRLNWLRAAFKGFPQVSFAGIMDDIPIDYGDSDIWLQHVQLMRQAIEDTDQQRQAIVAVDAVFSSEPYGQQLAEYFNAASICLDHARSLYPVSSSMVRDNPPAHWGFLAQEVQAWLCLRVIIVGAESTGKTTLAKALAAHYQQKAGGWANTPWVAEYGREHTCHKLAVAQGLAHAKGEAVPDLTWLQWTTAEFIHIAETQMRWEDQAAQTGSPLLIADTDAFATGVWHERYMGSRCAPVEAISSRFSPHRLYILTDVAAVPFEQDGIRDGEHIRDWMQQRFVERLQEQDFAWLQVSGDAKQCLLSAVAAIEKHLQTVWSFSPKWQNRQAITDAKSPE